MMSFWCCDWRRRKRRVDEGNKERKGASRGQRETDRDDKRKR